VALDFTRFLDTFALANRLFVPLVQSEYEIVDDFSGYKPGADDFGHSDHKQGPVKRSSARLVMFTVHATWPGSSPVPN
jgi:hypothetical protein